MRAIYVSAPVECPYRADCKCSLYPHIDCEYLAVFPDGCQLVEVKE